VVNLPTEEEIDTISARLDDANDVIREPIPEFTIPRDHVPLILAALNPVEKSDYPAVWDERTLGHLTITTKTGRQIHIAFCFAGHNPLCYSVDGVRCLRGGKYQPVAMIGHFGVAAEALITVWATLRKRLSR
jgi:hypothetical protein